MLQSEIGAVGRCCLLCRWMAGEQGKKLLQHKKRPKSEKENEWMNEEEEAAWEAYENTTRPCLVVSTINEDWKAAANETKALFASCTRYK